MPAARRAALAAALAVGEPGFGWPSIREGRTATRALRRGRPATADQSGSCTTRTGSGQARAENLSTR